MFTKLSFRNASLALLVLFSTICLLPMNLFAHDHRDHDNLHIHDVDAQTSTSIDYYAHRDLVSCGAYAGVWNNSNIPVRYYYSNSFIVHRKRSKNPFYIDSDSGKGSVNPGDFISFFPAFSADMTGAPFGRYIARSDVEMGLKFDFNGDGVFDDGRSVSSSAILEFEVIR